MLPQLATATFPSQIFWVVIGFFCVYGIISFVAVPRLKKILDDRRSRVDGLLDAAEKFKKKSEKIEKESRELIEKTKKEAFVAEEKLVNELEKKSFEEKQGISKEILENADKEIASLKISSEEALQNMSSNLDDLLDLAFHRIGKRRS